VRWSVPPPTVYHDAPRKAPPFSVKTIRFLKPHPTRFLEGPIHRRHRNPLLRRVAHFFFLKKFPLPIPASTSGFQSTRTNPFRFFGLSKQARLKPSPATYTFWVRPRMEWLETCIPQRETGEILPDSAAPEPCATFGKISAAFTRSALILTFYGTDWLLSPKPTVHTHMRRDSSKFVHSLPSLVAFILHPWLVTAGR